MSPSYSVSVRLQRIRTEAAHVSVPLTSEMWRPSDDDPKRMTVDADKLMAAAIQLGAHAGTIWKPDGEPAIQPHPVQTPPDSSPS